MNDQVSQILHRLKAGDREAQQELLPAVYDELKQIAERHMRHERPDHTLQTTALVHEAFLRLVDQDQADWQGKSHFCAVASTAMRRVLLDYARRNAAAKRGAGKKLHLSVGDDEQPARDGSSLDLLALDEALQRLQELDPRMAQVVELRFFGGLTIKEVAHVLNVSIATVKNDWRVARTRLMMEMGL